MKKLCFRFLPALLLLCTLLQPLAAAAAPNAGSLTLEYTHSGTAFAGQSIRIYRVADLAPDGSCDLTAPFDAYPVEIHGITTQKEWQNAAKTLTAYIIADGPEPDATARTDENGTAKFSGLELGVYLILGFDAANEQGSCRFESFFLFLPTPQDDGSRQFDLCAKPKGAFTPKPQTPSNVTYRVVKYWNDAGNRTKRPASITVDLLKNGRVQQTVILNPGNNWCYQWTAPEGDGSWSVVERDVPDDYRVVITGSGTVFQITNTHTEPSKPPKTGDTAALWLYVLVLCLSGLGLLIVAMGIKRRNDREKHR